MQFIYTHGASEELTCLDVLEQIKSNDLIVSGIFGTFPESFSNEFHDITITSVWDKGTVDDLIKEQVSMLAQTNGCIVVDARVLIEDEDARKQAVYLNTHPLLNIWIIVASSSAGELDTAMNIVQQDKDNITKPVEQEGRDPPPRMCTIC